MTSTSISVARPSATKSRPNRESVLGAALYHPDASIVQVEMFMDVQELRGGSDGIRETMRGMEVHRKLPDGTWAFLIDHPFGADASWAIETLVVMDLNRIAIDILAFDEAPRTR